MGTGDDVQSACRDETARRLDNESGGDESRPIPRRVLVADDSAVARLFTRKLLTTRGHDVVLANNGREALDALADQPFDVVLMDLQMPVLDGREAIRLLCTGDAARPSAPEPANPRAARRPIVFAMTATPSDVEAGSELAAHIQGVLAKPLASDAVIAAVESQQSTRPVPQVEANGAADDLPEPLDWDGAAVRMGGRYETLPRLAELLREECEDVRAQILDAMAQRDHAVLRRGAHTLKGSAAVFVARPTVAAAQRLEDLADGGDWEAISTAWRTLSGEIDRLLDALASTPRGRS